jgi:LuxR family maltose regulon positive regulatory protein
VILAGQAVATSSLERVEMGGSVERHRPGPVADVRTAWVDRSSLIRRIDRMPGGGLGVVVAPAGSGKSVLVRQWASQQAPSSIAWLNLDARHDDAVVFLRELVAVLDACAPRSPGDLPKLLPVGGARLGPDLVEALLASFDQLPGEVTIVLEDLHRIGNAAIVEDLGSFVTRLPDQVRLVVTSRWDPPWAIHRIRVEGRLEELRGADLAFGSSDGRELLALVSGREVTEAQARSLVDRTDGWAAGLQLAAILLQDAPDPDRLVSSLSGTERVIAEYLVEEVIDQQEPGLRDFLLRTSVLEWFTPELCDAVTGESSARERIEELEHRSLFLVHLDAHAERYRYHHLFTDLLRYRARRDLPDQVHLMHERAACWLLDAGDVAGAVAHLLAAGRNDEAYRIISVEGHQWFERGESATLVRWLSALVSSYGGLGRAPVAACVNLLAAQVGADESTAAAVTHQHLVRRTDATAGERVAADALHCLLVFRELSPYEALKLARSVRETLPLIDPDEVVDFLGLGGRDSVEIMAIYAEGWASFLTGDLEGSAEVLRAGLERPGAGYPMWRIYVQGALALVQAWAGHCTEALAMAGGAVDTAVRFAAVHHEAITSPHLAMGLVHVDRLETRQAAECLERADALNRRRLSSFVFIDLHRAIEARLLALTDGSRAALAALNEPSSCVVEAPLLAAANTALEIQLRLLSGDTSVARGRLAASAGEPAPAAGIDLALASGDLAGARRWLEAWTPDPPDLRSVIARRLRAASVFEAAAEPARAMDEIAEAVALARGDQLRWPFLEVPAALKMLRQGSRTPAAFLAPLLDGQAPRLDPLVAAQDRLIEPLTSRELEILAYLPARAKNQQIAAELYISINTLKSHLRSIYRKLDAVDRDEAVRRAVELGLL